MNKNTHIFICSASRSCMIAVAETVGSYSKSRSSASSAHGRIPRCRKTSESSALYLSNKPVAHVICAQAAPEVIATDFTFDASVGVSYSVMTQSVGFSASASKGQGKAMAKTQATPTQPSPQATLPPSRAAVTPPSKALSSPPTPLRQTQASNLVAA